ncbi:MAG: NAD(P)-dependent oxidoreductase [Rhizobiaceae bacterium]|nr:NAD(P)-dependent oxidoreductase [Rhizobiaceae bacterium]
MATIATGDGVHHRPRIALLGWVPPDILKVIAARFDPVDRDGLSDLSEAQRAAITHGLTSAKSGLDADELGDLAGLTTIASVGAGMENFDLPQLSARGIKVHPTANAMSEDTAEFAVGLVFALLRHIVKNDGFVRRGDWAAGRAPLGWRISQRRVGVVGLGRIGAKVAQKLAALGCDIAYTARTQKDVDWRFEPEIADLARTVDVLVLCCSGGEATRGLVDANVLDLLGPNGHLVNVSRGTVVDEPALLHALEQGTIAGAALDVFESEPTPNPRFLALSNCILQPHTSVLTRENRGDLIAELTRLLDH